MLDEKTEYAIRLAGEASNVLIYLVLYVISWAILVSRGVFPSLLFHLKHAIWGDEASGKRKPFPLLPSTILLLCNILCLHRIVNQFLLVVYDALVLSSGKQPIIDHVDMAIGLLGYVLCHVIFALMLVLWTKKMMGLVSISQATAATKFNVCFYVFTYVVAITSSVFVVIICIPPFVIYISLLGLQNPKLVTYTLHYTAVPVGIVLTVLLSFLIIVIGLSIMVQLGKGTKSKGITVRLKALMAKLSLAIIALPAGNLIRALGIGLFAIDVPTFSYVQSIYFVTSLPETLILSAIFFCFWPFALCCGQKKKLEKERTASITMTPDTSRAFLRTFLQPAENQEYETVMIPLNDVESGDPTSAKKSSSLRSSKRKSSQRSSTNSETSVAQSNSQAAPAEAIATPTAEPVHDSTTTVTLPSAAAEHTEDV